MLQLSHADNLIKHHFLTSIAFKIIKASTKNYQINYID